MSLISAFYGAVDRVGRVIEMEREHIEDLVAEGKAKYEMDRARAARRAQAAAPRHREADVARPGQAA